jgi:hypothetical protein
MNSPSTALTLAILGAILASTPCVIAKERPRQDCKVYFTVVEHDEQTSNLKMVGLNRPQKEWYEKHAAKEAPGLCFVGGRESGVPVTIENVDEKYVESIVDSKPLYAILWEQHQVFVPDDQGGHYAFRSTGVLYAWKPSENGDGRLVAISPVHNTNRTILSSSSSSLLKDALNEITKRAEP